MNCRRPACGRRQRSRGNATDAELLSHARDRLDVTVVRRRAARKLQSHSVPRAQMWFQHSACDHRHSFRSISHRV